MISRISAYIKTSAELKLSLLDDADFIGSVARAVEMIGKCLRNGNKLLLAGNGGSAADAQHFAGELVCTFAKKDRRGYPAIALSTNTSVITAWSNDFDYKTVFSRQTEALGKLGDIFLGISTSGNSANVMLAFQKAKEMGLNTVGFLGNEGGAMKAFCDIPLVVPSKSTPRIQEAHTLLMHVICEELEMEYL